ncbi:DUF2254 domain-containing protein [Flocculibacter collagenilyticus]|uniref:DUF2254 domain-containing protein n=1 Tax=Flocculibacter collagenilyticus TaxID=2744479 RepID=UPI0018F41CFC|nr:DUF2254 domain-containing protein [Flocculibacter collagenilyticus]
MKTLLNNYLERIRASFWFIPTLMVVFSGYLSFLFIDLDKTRQGNITFITKMLGEVGPEGARSILTMIAGSMINVTSVAFSITIVALTLASSQFGPRLLRNFMTDRGVQFVLGTFISTFIYCLIILRAIHLSGEHYFVPNLSVLFGLVLAILSVGVLIYFIHHVSASIQADNVCEDVYSELTHQVRRIFPAAIGSSDSGLNLSDDEVESIVKSYADNKFEITAPRSGYLQAVDHERLLAFATEYDYIVQLDISPGDYIFTGSCLLTVCSKTRIDAKTTNNLADLFFIGTQRTPEQDAEFAIRQLVEVAIRALSPGINDPYTALGCVDRLASTMCYLTDKSFPSPHRFDDNNKLRVIAKTVTFSGMLNEAFDQVRQYGMTSISIIIRLLEALTAIAKQANTQEQRSAIERQGNMIFRGSQASVNEPNDLEDIKLRYDKLMEVLSNHA